MSATSSQASTPSTSPSTSLSSSTRPMQIGFTPSGTDALFDIFHASTPESSRYSTCAFPSWPSGLVLKKAHNGRASAYISDEELFGDDDVPYLKEPPSPPRPTQMWAVAQPLLPPVRTRRPSSSSSQKAKRHSKLSPSSKK